MHKSMFSTTKGFSLIELLVVIAIITILLSIVLFSITAARVDSRDKRRVADTANLAHALTLYREKNRDYPSYQNGISLTDGPLDDDIKTLNGNLYQDPIYEDDASYTYMYYSALTCNNVSVHAIIATKMEKESNSNFIEMCGPSEEFSSAYVVILK